MNINKRSTSPNWDEITIESLHENPSDPSLHNIVIPSAFQREHVPLESPPDTVGPKSPSFTTPGKGLETSLSPKAVELPSQLRYSSGKRKTFERFKFDKAHNCSNNKRYVNSIVKTLAILPCAGRAYHANYTLALAMDSMCVALTSSLEIPLYFMPTKALILTSLPLSNPSLVSVELNSLSP